MGRHHNSQGLLNAGTWTGNWHWFHMLHAHTVLEFLATVPGVDWNNGVNLDNYTTHIISNDRRVFWTTARVN